MNEAQFDDDDPFTARLVAYDDALAAGTPPVDATPDDDDLRDAKACLDQLAAIWPRRSHPTSATRLPAETLTETPAQTQLGRFRIVRELGRGGGGIVYLAYDPTLHRQVALKVPRPESLFTSELRRRFVREAELAAQLNHVNIVPIHEAGEAGGVCYLVSAYCSGPNLAQWLRGRIVPARQAAQIVDALADGVAHMHGRGILHRDIKPTNVLLELDQGSAAPDDLGFVPRLTDFGLAKLDVPPAEFPGTIVAAMTCSGAILGTPAYMAPEQAEGRLEHINPATDVYALGVVLYELLAGHPPFRGGNDVAVLQQVVTDEPTPLRRLRRDVPRDLEAVCLKCLEKRPTSRYGGAAELAADLRNFLDGKPTVARPLPLPLRAFKWMKRRPLAATLLASVLVTAASIAAVAAWYAARQDQHDSALSNISSKLSEAEKREQEQRRLAKEGKQQIALNAYADRFEQAAQLQKQGRMLRAVEVLMSLQPAPDDQDLRGFEWHYLRGQCHPFHATWRAHEEGIHCLAGTRDGKTLATSSRSLTDIRLWETESGRLRSVLEGQPVRTRFLAFAPDGRSLASGYTRDKLGHLTLWDIASGTLRKTVPLGEAPWLHGEYTPDGKAVAVVTALAVGVYDAQSGQQRFHHVPGHHLIGVAIPPDQQSVITGTGHGVVCSFGVVPGVEETRHLSLHASASGPVALAPDGRTLASAGKDRLVVLWDLPTDRHTATLRHADRGVDFAWSPDGRTLAVLHENAPHYLKLWDIPACLPLPEIPKSELGDITGLAFVPGTSLLALGCSDGVIKIVETGGPPRPLELVGHAPDETWALAFSPDGGTLASGGDDRLVRLWDTKTGALLHTLEGHESLVTAVDFSKDGKTLASASYDGTVRLWDVAARKSRATFSAGAKLRCLALSPDGALVAAGTRGGDVGNFHLWVTATGKDLGPLEAGIKNVRGVAFSSDGATLATGTEDGKIRLWDTVSWKSTVSLDIADQVTCLAFAPDGRTLAWGSRKGEMYLWDIRTPAEKLITVPGHTGEITGVTFSRDGLSVATAAEDKTIRLGQAGTGRELLVLEGHDARVNAVAFAPDSRTLASAGHDGQIRIWSHASTPRMPVARVAPEPFARMAVPGAAIKAGRQQYEVIKAVCVTTQLSVQDDGKILVTGAAKLPGQPGSSLAATRFHVDGARDTTFGEDGMALAKHERVARWDSAGLLVMPDGKLVLLGTVSHNGTSDSAQDFLLAGFSPKGQPDLAFGHKGIVMTEYPGKRIVTAAGALTPDGKIILAGTTTGTWPPSAAASAHHRWGILARHLNDGKLDPDFGQGGLARFEGSFDGQTEFWSVEPRPDGKLLVLGISGPKAILLQYEANGRQLDAAFGASGLVDVAIPTDTRVYSWRMRMKRLADGKILTAISWISGTQPHEWRVGISLARYEADGKLDPTYGDNGRCVQTFVSTFNLTALSIMPDGAVLAASEAVNRGGYVTLARFTSDGRLDPGFGKDGWLYLDLKGMGSIFDLRVQKDGKILAAGDLYVDRVPHIVIYRFHPDVRPDPPR